MHIRLTVDLIPTVKVIVHREGEFPIVPGVGPVQPAESALEAPAAEITPEAPAVEETPIAPVDEAPKAD